MDLLEKLNSEQLKAVTHKDGPLLIVAGAGTGKTTVITQRIAYLIEQGKAASDEILALTFTEKAAGEMEERVDCLLPMGYLELWISTFHSFGERILAEHGLEIGLPTGAKLLNEFDQWMLIKNNLDAFNLDYYRPLGNPTKFIHALVKHFSRAKDEDINPAEYLEYAEESKENMDIMLSGGGKRKSTKSQITNSKKIQNSKFKIQNITDANGKVDKEMLEQEISRINEVANAYHVYQQLLLDNNALDFGDLINYTLKLFRERPVVLKKYREQFKYILLDEFQDTNWSQYELIKLLAAPKNNLVVVGDDDQSIYKFRGASLSNILQFKKDFPRAKEIVLVKNYRNRQNILDLSYQFIQLNNPNRLEYQLNKTQKGKEDSKGQSRLDKKLVAQEKGKGKIEVIQGKDLNEEVKMVVEKIADLKIKDKQSTWNDFAILVRANESAKDFTSALDIAGLPYQFLASRGLYSKPVIMDILAYLKLLDDYHESPALYRILCLPIFNLSYQELVNFNYVANKKAWSLYSVMKDAGGRFGAEVQGKIDVVLNLINKHTAIVREKSTTEIVLAFLNDSGYLKYLTSQDEQTSREIAGYLNQFVKRIAKFETGSDDKSVKAFLAELNLEMESGEQGSLMADIESGPEAIKIMTVHAAKGLEFKYVFIPNLVDKRFPTIERKEPIAVPDPLIKEILPEGDIHLEEERRLFYVAITRAKQGVFFSWAPDYGGKRKKKPSRFLIECGLISDDTPTTKQLSNETGLTTAVIKLDHELVPEKTTGYKPPSYFSYTQLAAFSNCPYQYRFAHVLRIPRRGKANFSFGKTMHSTMQKLFELVLEKTNKQQADLFSRKKKLPLSQNTAQSDIHIDEILAVYEQSWIDEWYQSKAQKEEYKKLGKNIIKEFHAKYNRNWPAAKFLEKGFNLKLSVNGEFCTVRGVIDRVDERKGEIKIVDYKTGRPKAKLSFNDKEQLLIYQLAAKDVFKEDVAALSFYYLENNTEVEFLGTKEELEKIKEKILTTIKDIQAGEFPPHPSQLCQFCDFNSICEFRKF